LRDRRVGFWAGPVGRAPAVGIPLCGVCLRRAAEALSRLVRLPIGWSLLAVVLLIVAFLAGMGWFFAQSIASQFNQLAQQLPAAAAKVARHDQAVGRGQDPCCSISIPAICRPPRQQNGIWAAVFLFGFVIVLRVD